MDIMKIYRIVNIGNCIVIPHTSLDGVSSGLEILEIDLATSLKVKLNIQHSNSVPGNLLKRKTNVCLYVNVYGRISHNN